MRFFRCVLNGYNPKSTVMGDLIEYPLRFVDSGQPSCKIGDGILKGDL